MSSPAAASELPVHLTRFIGRDGELNDLARLLNSTRLLTLTGAGGSGKTRLAREVAERSADRFTQVVWVELAQLAEPEEVESQVAAALRAPERPVSCTERVIDAVGDDRVLLVFDNCEHLVDACAALATTLLRACPQMAIVATSREALGVAGETAWLVPPLASPEAIQLFADRAAAALPSFTVNEMNAAAVDEICRRLDGIPLAIELAAARVKVLSPEQIASRLDDAFRLLASSSRSAIPRHRTLRATMEWSHSLLGDREQILLRRLAVFVGSFTLEAAEAACAGELLESEDILDGVSALVDRSLVVMDATENVARYRLLETVRQYAFERLEAAGEGEDAERAHATYFLGVIEGAAPRLFGGESEPGLIARLMTDDDNLRAASQWAVRVEPTGEMALRFADSLFWYWYGSNSRRGRGQYAEGRPYVLAALARGEECAPMLRARAFASRGLIGVSVGDYTDAIAAFTEAIALTRMHGEAPELAFMLAKLGAALLMAGSLDAAEEVLAEATRIIEPMPRGMMHAFVWFWHSWTRLERGDRAGARAMSDLHLALGYESAHRTTQGHSHTILGRIELADGNLDAAFAQFTLALPFHLDLLDGWGLILDLEGFAAVAAARRRYADAARLLGASDAMRERTMNAIVATEREERDARIAKLRDKLGMRELTRLLAEGRTLSTDDIVRIATDDTIAHTTEFRVVQTGEVRAARVSVPMPPQVPKLRVLALGPLQVIVGGKAVEPSAWGSARPRELLVYLLMHPEGRTKEQVGLAFWPDASAAQLRNSFHVTLHRLRKALGGAEWVTLAQDRYRVEPSLVEEFDVHLFEREVAEARKAVKNGEAGATARLEHALARFRGDLLDGEPIGDWHLEHRDRTQRAYVDALMELGARHMLEQRFEKGAEAFRRVLARDALHEEAVVALMRCHAELGERAPALRVFKRFSELLRQELDAEPDHETLELSERLARAN